MRALQVLLFCINYVFHKKESGHVLAAVCFSVYIFVHVQAQAWLGLIITFQRLITVYPNECSLSDSIAKKVQERMASLQLLI